MAQKLQKNNRNPPGLMSGAAIALTLVFGSLVLRQNPIHVRFQQLRLSFSRPKISRSKFDPSLEGPLITASWVHYLFFRQSPLEIKSLSRVGIAAVTSPS
jgi:hypothetical protein